MNSRDEIERLVTEICTSVAAAHGVPVIIMEPVKGGMLATPPEPVAATTRSVAALADEVLERVKSCPPQFFERLVVQLLIQRKWQHRR